MRALPRSTYRIEHLIVSSNSSSTVGSNSVMSAPKPETLSSIGKISSDIVFITTQDDRIADVADELVDRVPPGTFVFHTSGSRSSAILNCLSAIGCKSGSLHPMVSISTVPLPKNQFRGVYFCVEGDTEAMELSRAIVSDLQGIPFSIPTNSKTLYHAGAVFASGHLIALIDGAKQLMVESGVESDEAINILLPLIHSSVSNLSRLPAAQALTGTFARADEGTFLQHLEVLTNRPSSDLLQIYLLLARRSLALALENGADPRAVDKISSEISLALGNAE